MNITVYCGSAEGSDPEYAKRAAELGAWMAAHGHRLIYGAGNKGMMGILSGALLEKGGEATGVTPEFFILDEDTRDDLTELIVAEDMPVRRRIMMELGDAFIALPGGMGTLDEISEIMTMNRLGMLGDIKKPVMVYNVNGYYDSFFAFLDDMNDREFCRQKDRDSVIEVSCIEDIERALGDALKFDDDRTTRFTRFVIDRP